jgi:hypothetical protein
MTIAMMLALLVQAGVCAPIDFTASDGSALTVVVCPIARQAPADPQAPGDSQVAPVAPPTEDRTL